MAWKQFSQGYRLNPAAKGSPETLVVLLDDPEASARMLMPAASLWAAAVPTAAFVAFDGLPAELEGEGAQQSSAKLERAARHLEPLLVQELNACHLGIGQLVLVGVAAGATLALHLCLLRGWECGGVLGLDAKLERPLPVLPRNGNKVRLIVTAKPDDPGHARLRDLTTSLTSRGIDTRGVVLPGPLLSDETVRHGASYLVELVATAHRRGRLRTQSGAGHVL
jgi:predicted esterase